MIFLYIYLTLFKVDKFNGKYFQSVHYQHSSNNQFFFENYKTLPYISSEILFTIFLIAFINSSVFGFSE